MKKQTSSYPHLDVTTLTVAEWQQSVTRTNYAIELMQDTRFRELLAVLINARPRGFPLRGRATSPEELPLELGRREGYDTCLETLLALANPLETPTPIQETYHAQTTGPDTTA